MNIDKSRISSQRFMFTIICFLQASSLLTSFVAAVTKQDSWFSVLGAMIAFLPILLLYRAIALMDPGKNLLELCEMAFGTPVGKAVGVLYCWFFLTLAALNVNDLGDFTRLTLMEQTPNAVLVALCLVVSSMAVRRGLRAVVWYSALYMVIAFAILLLTVVLVGNRLNFQNFLPMFDLSPGKYLQGIHIASTIPFGELVMFLMITPNVNLTPGSLTRSLFLGFALGSVTTLVVIARDIAVLGNTMPMFTLPSLVTLTLVHLGEALSRMEILFAIVLIMLLFIKVTLLYYVTVRTIAQVLGARSIKHLTLAVGALIIVYGQTLYTDAVQHALSAQEIVPFAWTPFEFLLPLLLLIVAKIRKLPARKEA